MIQLVVAPAALMLNGDLLRLFDTKAKYSYIAQTRYVDGIYLVIFHPTRGQMHNIYCMVYTHI